MPESPEVEALVEWLDGRLAGARVEAVDVVEFRAVKTRARPLPSIVGERISAFARAGKYIDIELDSAHVVVSLGRHGWVRWSEGGPAAPGEPSVDGAATGAPALVTFTVDGGLLAFTDAGSWVSLGLWVVDRADEVPGVAKLGPDPLGASFSPADVAGAVSGRRKQLKAILQEQESFAGIGNAYSDEILHRARLSPVVHGDALTPDELSRLATAMRTVLTGAARDRRGIPIERLKQAKADAMVVHGRTGAECPVCGGRVEDFAFGGTTAQYCPVCQTGGVPLA